MSDKILEQVQSFIKKTEEGKIDWKFLNANAVRFTTQIGDKSYILTLQSQGAPPRVTYTFVAQMTNPNETLLQIQTQIMPQYSGLIEKLFALAMGNSKINSSKEIDDLLNNL